MSPFIADYLLSLIYLFPFYTDSSNFLVVSSSFSRQLSRVFRIKWSQGDVT